jgi:hypothetical protein
MFNNLKTICKKGTAYNIGFAKAGLKLSVENFFFFFRKTNFLLQIFVF